MPQISMVEAVAAAAKAALAMHLLHDCAAAPAVRRTLGCESVKEIVSQQMGSVQNGVHIEFFGTAEVDVLCGNGQKVERRSVVYEGRLSRDHAPMITRLDRAATVAG